MNSFNLGPNQPQNLTSDSGIAGRILHGRRRIRQRGTRDKCSRSRRIPCNGKRESCALPCPLIDTTKTRLKPVPIAPPQVPKPEKSPPRVRKRFSVVTELE